MTNIHKLYLIVLMLFAMQNANAHEFKQSKKDLNILKRNTVLLVNLWDSINYSTKKMNDPYSIETWEKKFIEKYNWAVQNKDSNLIFATSIPLSFTYHSESKFKKGLPILEYLYTNKNRLNPRQYKEVLIKLEEEYRALHMIDKAIPIRQERINNKFINNFWEIYRDCGLYDAAKKDLLAFVPIPPKYTTKRLSYYFLLGSLCVDLKQIDSAKIYFGIGLKETEECIEENNKNKHYEPNKLTYWKACFMGLITRCKILKGDYINAIDILKYDISESYENLDNKIDKMNLLAQTYIHFNQFQDAKKYLDSVNVLITEKNINPIQLDYLYTKSDYFSKTKKIDSALYYYKWYNTLKEDNYQNIQKNQSVLLLAQMEISNRRTELLEISQTLLKSNKEKNQQNCF